MGGPQPGARDDDDVMGGPGWPTEVMRGMVRPAGLPYGTRRATDLMGEAGVRSQGHPDIFPNLWVTISGTQMCLRLPRGPSHTELWWFTLVPKAAPPLPILRPAAR